MGFDYFAFTKIAFPTVVLLLHTGVGGNIQLVGTGMFVLFLRNHGDDVIYIYGFFACRPPRLSFQSQFWRPSDATHNNLNQTPTHNNLNQTRNTHRYEQYW